MPTISESLNWWRSIIERGRATSTYKMALALGIARMVESGTRHVNRRELAELFFDIYFDRLCADMPQLSDPNKTTILEQAISGFKAGGLTREQAVSMIERDGFNDVLGAFHNLDGGRAPIQFYTYSSSGLSLTDAAYQVFQSPEKDQLLRQIDSRWSRLEETFARNRLGSNVSLWVAGTETGREAGYVWCRGNASEGSILGAGTGIREFAEGISDDLAKGYRVSVGFEYPLSVLVPRQSEQFRTWTTEQEKHLKVCEQSHILQGSLGYGSPVCGLAETAWVLRELRDSTRGASQPTFSWRRFVDNHANLFVWEAAVSRTQTALPHVSKAQLAAASFLNSYPRLYPQETAEGDIPLSLGAAALMWAGFRLDEDALRSPCVVVRAG
jgi:hypothetical protein